MIVKIVFIILAVVFFLVGCWSYETSRHTDDFGQGFVVLAAFALFMICALCAYFLPIRS